MIFVDTGAWYALATPSDPDHQNARQFVTSNTQPLATSDYVIDELLTLFMVRDGKHRGIEWCRAVLARGAFRMLRVADDDFARALQLYEQFADKRWSFTDCTSYILMQRWQIATAFAFDDHFRQFGTVTVLPPE
jgi:predicted nucleic acid-binding protein